jgi:hypothetical protein
VQFVVVSVAVIVNVNSPTAVGVPVRAPAALSERPAGRLPRVTANVWGPVPPAAVRFCE